MRAAGRSHWYQHHCAGRAKFAPGGIGQAQVADAFIGSAHALKNMGIKPVHPTVEQVAGEHIGRHARISQDAERGILAAGHVERAQIIAPVQGEADNLVPR